MTLVSISYLSTSRRSAFDLVCLFSRDLSRWDPNVSSKWSSSSERNTTSPSIERLSQLLSKLCLIGKGPTSSPQADGGKSALRLNEGVPHRPPIPAKGSLHFIILTGITILLFLILDEDSQTVMSGAIMTPFFLFVEMRNLNIDHHLMAFAPHRYHKCSPHETKT